MRRGRLLLVALAALVAVLVLFGGRWARAIEHWLLALHGRH